MVPLSFIQAGALQGEPITVSCGFRASACLVSGTTSARSWAIENRASDGSVWPAGTSS